MSDFTDLDDVARGGRTSIPPGLPPSMFMTTYLEDYLERCQLPIDLSIFNTILNSPGHRCSVNFIAERCGDIAVFRCGVLTALERLTPVGGGGEQPYILAAHPDFLSPIK